MQASLAASRRRAYQETQRRERELTSIATAGLYGWMKSSETQIPTFGGVEPSLLYGAAAYALPEVTRMGAGGKILRSVGTGLLTVAAYEVAKTGSIDRVSGDEVGWEDYADFEHDY